jgi:hypothetical protein
MKTLALLLGLALVASILVVMVNAAEATTYYIRFVVNFYDKDIFNCINEIYMRASDAAIDPKTGEHSILLARTTIEDPDRAQYIVKLPFNPLKTTQNSGQIREYLLLLQNDAVVYKDYKHPYTPFDPQRTQYTFTHNVRTDLGCGQSVSTNSIQTQEHHLRILKVPRGDLPG